MATKSEPQKTSAQDNREVKSVQGAAAEQIAAKPTRRWRARIFQGYLLVATVGFTILVILASTTNYFLADLTVTRTVQEVNSIWFQGLMWIISFPGYSPQMIILVAAVCVVMFAIGLRWEAVVAVLAAILSSGLGQLIKIIVHRPRPGSDLVTVFQQLNSYSFPSGHVLGYTAFFGFLFFLSYTLLRRNFLRAALLEVLGILIGLVGLSRIYLGDHWASDVIGAYLLGSLCLVACIYLYQWGKTRFFVRQPLAPEKPAAPTQETPKPKT